VAALLGGMLRVVADQVAGGGLLLEPLARVAGGDAGSCGDLGLGGGPEVGERLVEPQLQAQVDAERLQRVGGGIDEPLGERLARVEVGVGGHGSSFAAAAGPTAACSVVPGAYRPRTGGVRRLYVTSRMVLASHLGWARSPGADAAHCCPGGR